jgi:hypothetical protein
MRKFLKFIVGFFTVSIISGLLQKYVTGDSPKGNNISVWSSIGIVLFLYFGIRAIYRVRGHNFDDDRS